MYESPYCWITVRCFEVLICPLKGELDFGAQIDHANPTVPNARPHIVTFSGSKLVPASHTTVLASCAIRARATLRTRVPWHLCSTKPSHPVPSGPSSVWPFIQSARWRFQYTADYRLALTTLMTHSPIARHADGDDARHRWRHCDVMRTDCHMTNLRCAAAYIIGFYRWYDRKCGNW